MTKLLAEVKAEGTATVYSQWMKSTKGRQFCISNGLMWNIETATGLQRAPLLCWCLALLCWTLALVYVQNFRVASTHVQVA